MNVCSVVKLFLTLISKKIKIEIRIGRIKSGIKTRKEIIMRLSPDHPDFETTLVFFNDKLCKVFIAADDEEGWIELPDIKAMSPLKTTEDSLEEESELQEWEEIPIIRKTGKVEFKNLKK
jgi:hypothetical protein